MEKLVLYSDKSGVMGKWCLGEFNEWTFKKDFTTGMTAHDMLYVLSELEKIQKSMKRVKK